jgi:RNA polymerase-binding transcription factor DksA
MPGAATNDELKRRLLERRRALLRRVGRIETDVRHQEEPLESDAEEQVVQLENDAVLAALDESGRRDLAAIDEALQRLADGRYGSCVRCGAGIARARLEALPTAATCARCAN